MNNIRAVAPTETSLWNFFNDVACGVTLNIQKTTLTGNVSSMWLDRLKPNYASEITMPHGHNEIITKQVQLIERRHLPRQEVTFLISKAARDQYKWTISSSRLGKRSWVVRRGFREKLKSTKQQIHHDCSSKSYMCQRSVQQRGTVRVT